MSNWLRIAMFASLAALSAHAQRLVVDGALDFGLVTADLRVERQLRLRNAGKKPLRISRVQVSCGCLAAELKNERLAPGEETLLVIQLDASQVSGHFERSLRIVSNDLEQAGHFVRIRGEVAVATGPSQATEAVDESGWRPREVLIKVAAPMRSMADLACDLQCDSSASVHRAGGWICLTLKDDESVTAALRRLSKHAEVLYAQPNYVYEPREVPNDPDFGIQWALQNTGQAIGTGQNAQGVPGADMQVLAAWELNQGASGGNGAIVAVLDNGVDYTHPELNGQMWDGTNCLDHNGDPLGDCIHGYDYSTSLGDTDPMPVSSDHGTHVAGVIGAAANNGIGIAGIAPNTKIMAVRSSNYSSVDFVKGIYFAAHNGATVINASWGYAASTCQTIRDEGQTTLPIGDRALYDAIADFPGLFVGAAGNSNREHNGSSWFDSTDYGHTVAGCWDALPNVFNVGASDNHDTRWTSSDWGLYVDILAPGKSIYSLSVDEKYVQKSGTSMAAPQAAAVAALIWGFRPELTVADVREYLFQGGECIATTSPYFTSDDAYCGAGFAKRLNAYRPLATLATPTVTNLRAYTDSTLTVEITDGGAIDGGQPYWTWDPPQGQGLIDHYRIVIDDGALYDQTITTPLFNAASHQVTFGAGPHSFEVIGVNDLGAIGAAVTFTWTEAGTIISTTPPASVVEGSTLSIPFNLTTADDQNPEVTVNYLLLGKEAFSAFESVWFQGTVVWPAGTSGLQQLDLDLSPFDNPYDQDDSQLRLILGPAQNAPIRPPTQRTITLVDDDLPPAMAISTPTSLNEAGYLDFVVSLDELSSKTVTFSYATADGTAVSPADYAGLSGSGLIGPGASSTMISVQIGEDVAVEGGETVRLLLTNAAPVDAARSVLDGTGTILDNDVALDVQPGWRLLSFPIQYASPSRSTLLPGADAVWRWNASAREFEQVDEIRPFEGYYANFFTSTNTILEGMPQLPGPHPLAMGWNLIGPAVSRALPLDNAALSPTVIYWNDAWSVPASLTLGTAYWIFAHRATTVDLYTEE